MDGNAKLVVPKCLQINCTNMPIRGNQYSCSSPYCAEHAPKMVLAQLREQRAAKEGDDTSDTSAYTASTDVSPPDNSGCHASPTTNEDAHDDPVIMAFQVTHYSPFW